MDKGHVRPGLKVGGRASLSLTTTIVGRDNNLLCMLSQSLIQTETVHLPNAFIELKEVHVDVS